MIIFMASPTTQYKTIPLRPKTYERLRDYKLGASTYDEVLNGLMDEVPLERVAKRVLSEHKRRLKNFHGVPWRRAKKEIGD
jgi:hypothetical protein